MLNRYTIRGRRPGIPSVSTKKQQTQPIDYKKGLYTGVPNDLQPAETLRYIRDMRFEGIGKYKTRKGCDHYSQTVGQAVNVQVTSTTGASNASFSATSWVAQKLTAASSGVMSRIDVNLKNSASATSSVVVSLYDDNSGSPGSLLASSTIQQSAITSSYAYATARFIQLPTVTSGLSYWVVVSLQESGTGSMFVSSTTSATTAKTSSSSGQAWSSAAYALNVKLYTATAGGVKGAVRVYRPNGQGYTFFAHATNLYLVNDSTSALSVVDSSISSGSTTVRFDFVNDVLYYTDGVGKPRKYNFSAASEVTASPHSVSNVMEHVGLLFFFDPADPTLMFYTNFADYETFTSTDFFYVPAPKKSDHLTGMGKLNGVLYPFTRKNKYMLLGQDNATFQLNEAYAQKGTFSQESIVADENYIYFASDDGVYQFNGTTEKNIFESIIDEYTGLVYKDDIHLQLHNNRLYVWYRPNGDAEANECYVYNTLYGVLESVDTSAFVGRSFARHDTTGQFLQASNRAGTIYYGEQSTNNYDNLGAKLLSEVRTAYDHFGSPQQLKRIPYWRPVLETVQGAYSLQAGFSADYSDDVTFSDISLQSTGATYDDAASLYDTSMYASSAASVDTSLNIFGSAYRWQRRYKHYAAGEPFVFAGEVLQIETQRLR
jgi:hypothetical protein